MKVKRVIFSAGTSAFFFDDQKAIKQGAGHDGFAYVGQPVTPGFRAIRQAGQSLSVLLELEDGQYALGDCAAVQYSGAGGRDPLFGSQASIPLLERHVKPLLQGVELDSFRDLTGRLEQMRVEGAGLHTALRYGLSQAILDAVAKANRLLPCEVVCREYRLPVIAEPIPVFGQTGDQRYENADKMILKQVDVLPHGLINTIDEKLGHRGEKLRDYIRWLVRRIRTLGGQAYRPTLHIDVYGTIGLIFNQDPGRVVDYLASLQEDAAGLPLYIEGPVDMDAKDRQIQALRQIRQSLEKQGSAVKIVADEWCNTLEDIREFTDAQACHMVQIKTPDLGGIQNVVESVLYCHAHGMEAYQGGTCNETEVSTRLCVHVAATSRPQRMLAKPGMGFDEGFMIVSNEMARIVVILRSKQSQAGGEGAKPC